MKILALVITIVLSAIAIVVVTLLLVRRTQARNYVLLNREDFSTRLKVAEQRTKHNAVNSDTREILSLIRKAFDPINYLTYTDEKVSWIDTRKTLDKLMDDLDIITTDIENEIVSHSKSVSNGLHV